jgi:hypothetical protein
VGTQASRIEAKQIIATIATQALLAEHLTASHVRRSELPVTDAAAQANHMKRGTP